MFRFVLVTAAVVALLGSLYIAYSEPNSIPKPLQKYAPLIKKTVEAGIQGSEAALSKSREVQPAVMGARTESSQIFKEDTSGKPIHQQAMEFTQYQYCKMVVNSYEMEEARRNALSSPSPTSTPENK